jgi:hypothetical protein
MAQEDFQMAVAAYKACVASKPVQACDAERHIMDANANVLSGLLSQSQR